MPKFEHFCKSHCIRDPELLMRIGAATAIEVRATGITYAFAPCIAVSNYTIQALCMLESSFHV